MGGSAEVATEAGRDAVERLPVRATSLGGTRQILADRLLGESR